MKQQGDERVGDVVSLQAHEGTGIQICLWREKGLCGIVREAVV